MKTDNIVSLQQHFSQKEILNDVIKGNLSKSMSKSDTELRTIEGTTNIDYLVSLADDYPTPPSCYIPLSDGRIDKNGPRVMAFIGIVSGSGYSERRNAVRATWLRSMPSDFKYLFVLGMPPEERTDAIIEEMNKFGDMMVINSPEDYANILMQSLAGLYWGAEKCGAYYSFKVDDDTFLMPEVLKQRLKPYPPISNFVGIHRSAVKPIRAATDKWSLSHSRYEFDDYAPYAAGACYGVTYNIVLKLQMFKMEPLWVNPYVVYLEDVAMGLLVGSAAAHHINLKGNAFKTSCDTTATDTIFVHYMHPADMELAWENLQKSPPVAFCVGIAR